jgi:glycosyltransferase involved in cell wall biosynthesis
MPTHRLKGKKESLPAKDMKGKILLCSYYFPPIGSPRSYRWRELVKCLASKGWEIDVLTIRTTNKHPNYDPELLERMPDGVRIFRTHPGIMHHLSGLLLSKTAGDSGNVLFRTYESMRKTVGRLLFNLYENGLRYLFIPDEAVMWLPFALLKGSALNKENRYELIISSGFPFTCHILGYILKKLNGDIPWIVDYGDPWIDNPILPMPKWRTYTDKKIESRILKSARRLIVTTQETKEHYLSLYPFLTNENINVISQGYSPEDYEEIPPETTNKFRIVHTGKFYNANEPIIFFHSLKEIKQIWKDLEIVITSNLVNDESKRYAENSGLSEIVRFIGFVPHQRAIALQKGASLLLLIGHRGGIQVPGKIFEYIAAKRPILAIKNDEADLASKIVEKHQRGIVVTNDPQAIKDSLIHFHKLWKNKKLESNFNLEYVDDYSWDRLSEKLDKLISEAIR